MQLKMKRTWGLQYLYQIKYSPNLGVPKYIEQILTNIKGEIDSNTIIVGIVNTPVTSMDRSSRLRTKQNK